MITRRMSSMTTSTTCLRKDPGDWPPPVVVGALCCAPVPSPGVVGVAVGVPPRLGRGTGGADGAALGAADAHNGAPVPSPDVMGVAVGVPPRLERGTGGADGAALGAADVHHGVRGTSTLWLSSLALIREFSLPERSVAARHAKMIAPHASPNCNMTIITTHVLHWAHACDASVPHCDNESSGSSSSGSSASSTSKGSIARRGVEARASSAQLCFGAERSPPDKPFLPHFGDRRDILFSSVCEFFGVLIKEGDPRPKEDLPVSRGKLFGLFDFGVVLANPATRAYQHLSDSTMCDRMLNIWSIDVGS